MSKQKKQDQPKESTYTRADLAKHSKQAFGVSPEVVIGALSTSKQEEFTKSEAKQAIDNFMKRKV
ncbi:hypothetical protein GLV94_05315 [Virgibacillus halodenitrificans]|uniref:hypothetical protein n=1 Tax=Virgibacillus halodenitrificans TaxID=1482 RepID=UPI00136A00D8|nr:hypothetical protein [Virgibacillus halodenitrificans]MYL45054.1 hypothetical protein [Virgibacillus halodenitrificans]